MWGNGYQAVCESSRDKAVCASCRRKTKKWVVHGLDQDMDDDATSRRLCDRCAKVPRVGSAHG